MEAHKQKIYNPAIDILRVVSILSVVLIHTSTRTLEASSFDLRSFPFTFFLNQAFRFAVPLFFMISGFVLELNYQFHTNYFTYLKKRLSKILIPYVFWSFIYFFLYKISWPKFPEALLAGSASYQLYFIPTLLIFYILFPLLHAHYKVITKKSSLLLLGIIQIALLYYDYHIYPLPFFYPLSIALLNFYTFILGSVASHHEKRLLTFVEKWKYLILGITVLVIGYIFFEGFSGYLNTHDHRTFYSQWRPSILVYTITISSLLYYFFSKETAYLPFVKLMARLSFFVFFIHVMILEVVWSTIGKHIFLVSHTNMLQQFWFDPLFFTIVTLISFLLAFTIQKIPFVKNLTG